MWAFLFVLQVTKLVNEICFNKMKMAWMFEVSD